MSVAFEGTNAFLNQGEKKPQVAFDMPDLDFRLDGIIISYSRKELGYMEVKLETLRDIGNRFFPDDQKVVAVAKAAMEKNKSIFVTPLILVNGNQPHSPMQDHARQMLTLEFVRALIPSQIIVSGKRYSFRPQRRGCLLYCSDLGMCGDAKIC